MDILFKILIGIIIGFIISLLGNMIMRFIMYLTIRRQLRNLDRVTQFSYVTLKRITYFRKAFKKEIDNDTHEMYSNFVNDLNLTLEYLEYLDKHIDSKYLKHKINHDFLSLDLFDDECRNHTLYKTFIRIKNTMEDQCKNIHGFNKLMSFNNIKIQQYLAMIPKEELENEQEISTYTNN